MDFFCISISTNDFVDLLQAGIAVFSAILLYKTLKNSKEANKQQAEAMEIEMKAKRADYMPVYSIKINLIFKAAEQPPNPENIPENGTIYFKLIIEQNTITQFSIEFTNPNEKVFTAAKAVDFRDAFYKKGDEIKYPFFDFNKSDLSALMVTGSDHEKRIPFTMRFEDMVGNKYVQSGLYILKVNKPLLFPLLENKS